MVVSRDGNSLAPLLEAFQRQVWSCFTLFSSLIRVPLVLLTQNSRAAFSQKGRRAGLKWHIRLYVSCQICSVEILSQAGKWGMNNCVPIWRHSLCAQICSSAQVCWNLGSATPGASTSRDFVGVPLWFHHAIRGKSLLPRFKQLPRFLHGLLALF